jgi:GTP-binding protein HflX
MIDAFKSTLEESLAADLILLLIDSSEELENIKIKYYNCWNVLKDLKVDESKVSVILTKYDYDNCNGNNKNNVADDIGGMQKIDAIAKDLQLKDPLLISSKTGYGIHKLKNTIMALLKNG